MRRETHCLVSVVGRYEAVRRSDRYRCKAVSFEGLSAIVVVLALSGAVTRCIMVCFCDTSCSECKAQSRRRQFTPSWCCGGDESGMGVRFGRIRG